jgi:hypothetical protein
VLGGKSKREREQSMPAIRRKLQRQPRVSITPEIIEAFREVQKLEKLCTCKTKFDECGACSKWVVQMAIIRNALMLPPNFWPCLPSPNDRKASGSAIALYEELEMAIAQTS